MLSDRSSLPRRRERLSASSFGMNSCSHGERPAGRLIGLGIPLLLLVVLGSIPKLTQPDSTLGGLSFIEVYIPTLIGFDIAVTGILGLPGRWPHTGSKESCAGCPRRRFHRHGCWGRSWW